MSVSNEHKRRQGGLAETVRTFASALLIALVIRTLLFQAFSIPSGSMEATLLIGDYLFVSTYAYGYTHYALPFSPPVFSGRIFGSQPKRGDVVVFRLPWDESVDYIKRVIGLPGDRIEMIHGLLHINGVAVKRERAQDFIDRDEGPIPLRVTRWRETLPNGASYETLDRVENSDYDDTATTPTTAECRRRAAASAMCRSRISSAALRSFFSRSVTARMPGNCGAGRGRCVGAACS